MQAQRNDQTPRQNPHPALPARGREKGGANPHITAGRNALKQADRAARRGDLVAAERWSKAAERLADAAARFADTHEFDKAAYAEEVRADMLARLHRLVAAYRDNASIADLRRMEREMA